MCSYKYLNYHILINETLNNTFMLSIIHRIAQNKVTKSKKSRISIN